MSIRNGSEPDYLASLRRILLGAATVLLIALFLLWRVDNARVERLRAAIVDKVVPSFEWTINPVAATGRLLKDLRSYQRVHAQNEELRRELQRMKGWREAALQLEQKNARLLALNKVRLNARTTFVTGEIIADASSPFQRSAMVNVGRVDGVVDGSAAMDGLGLVGRIAGVGQRSARILLLTDGSSRVPAVIRPSGQHAIVSGNNSSAPFLEFLDQPDAVRTGDRIVTSGDGGLYPPDIVIGQVFTGHDGRLRARLAASYGHLDFVRVVRQLPMEEIHGPGGLIGPVLTAQPGATEESDDEGSVEQ
ncbi:rod shape-determining protein MreC [Amaricoccus macauensis]|uniref:rod shape-determining protein MreC n=1 Tax=Amaricoccus macauensis TaxID=57001 RepID=UPI003C7B092A